MDPAAGSGKGGVRFYPRIGRRGFVESDYDDPEFGVPMIYGKTSKQGIKLGRRKDLLDLHSGQDEEVDPWPTNLIQKELEAEAQEEDPSSVDAIRNALEVYKILANWRQRHQVRQVSDWRGIVDS